jgi:hypothetical protein
MKVDVRAAFSCLLEVVKQLVNLEANVNALDQVCSRRGNVDQYAGQAKCC